MALYSESPEVRALRERFTNRHLPCICSAKGDPKKEAPKLPPTRTVRRGDVFLTVCTRCSGIR
jgi:hypothetical protein